MAVWLKCPNCKCEIGIPDDAETEISCPKCRYPLVVVDPVTHVRWRPEQGAPSWMRPWGYVLTIIGGLAFFASMGQELSASHDPPFVALIVAGITNPLFFIGVPLGIYWLRCGKTPRHKLPMNSSVSTSNCNSSSTFDGLAGQPFSEVHKPCQDTRGQHATKSRRMSGTSWILFVMGFLFIRGFVVGLIESHSRVQPKQMQSDIESYERTQVVQRSFDHEYDKADSDAETQEILVAARDFKEKEILKPDMVKTARTSKSAVPVGAYSSFKDVEERWVKTTMLEGDPIVERMLGPKEIPSSLIASIPKGLGAFAIEVDEQSGVSGLILPGQRVDVVRYECNKRTREQRGQTILQDILVLAAGQVFTIPDKGTIQRRTVTFALTPEQVDVLVASRDRGNCSLRLHDHEVAQGERQVAVASSELGVGANDDKKGAAERDQTSERQESGDRRSTAAPTKDLTTEEIAAKSVASVAVIRGKGSVGSGFLVKPGILATNAHVVQRERIQDLHVNFPSAPESARGTLACELVYEDSMRDLALLSVVTNLRPLRVEDHYQFRRGQEVTVIGTPASENGFLFENAISRGVMSSKLQYEGRMIYQLNVSINPGNSGGPVLNPKGQVIGVATATVKSREALALCIPSEDLEKAVKVAEARPASERQRVLAIHSARSLLWDLDDMAVAYDVLVRAYTKTLEEAVRSGVDLNSANWVGRKYLDEKMRPLEDFVKASLYARLTSVCADPLVPVQIRLDIASLWKNCLEIRNQLYSPSDNFRDQLAQIQALELIHTKRIKELKDELDKD